METLSHSIRFVRVRFQIAASVLALALVCVVLLLASGCGSQTPKNVILITVTSLRADRLSSSTKPTNFTPTLDALAKDGALFSRAYTTSSSTAAAHATIHTGTHPWTHKVWSNGERLPSDVTTLAQQYKQAGYMTAAIVSSSQLDQRHNFDSGFEHFQEAFAFQNPDLDIRSKDATLATDAALSWLTESQHRPFFLWIHYFDPHGPYDAPDQHRLRSDTPDEDGFRLEGSRLNSGPGIIPSYQMVPGVMAPEPYIGSYNAEVRFVDHELGRLLSHLDETGTKKQSILILAGDHGESLGEQDHFFQHGHSTSEEQARVPLLILEGRSVPAGITHQTPVSLVDLAPTLLSLSGLPIPGHMEGVVLFPAADVEAASERDLFITSSGGSEKAVVRGNLKLTVDATGKEKKLVDVILDRRESTNLLSSNESEAKLLLEQLNKTGFPDAD